MTSAAEPGDPLHALYAQEGGVHQVFSAKVADYAASRPDYPAALFESIAGVCKLAGGAVIADIGAGTGLLTQGWLRQGYQVVAVEPNPAMRLAADSLLGATPGYRSVAGCAEAIPLPPASVDLLTAAQAFHWFEIEQARAECLRVLRPHGQVALIWNDRDGDDPLNMELDALFAEFGGARRAALVAHEDRATVPRFFGASVPLELSWPHAHALDEAGLACLVFSRSYMPPRHSPDGKQALLRLRGIFQRNAVSGRVQIRYTTLAILGRPAASAA